MAWVTDSRFAGYLGPDPSPAPLEDDEWIDFLHDVVAGVTDIDPTLVRPRWQMEPPPVPDITVDWVAIGITSSSEDWQPAIIHVSTGDGYDVFQRMERSELLCSFYGPHCMKFASLLRDGLFIDQNTAMLRAHAVAVVEIGNFTRAAELFRERWRDRIDVTVTLRREIRRNYPVRNIVRSQGIITANPPYDADHLIHTGYDTGDVEAGTQTQWDDDKTLWDNGTTLWDVP